jgi:hypothetical protein
MYAIVALAIYCNSNILQRRLVSSSGHQDEDVKKVHYRDAEKITENSPTVCLDEVTALPNSVYRAFRRAAKQSGVLSIFCDTANSICELMPSNDHSSSLNGGSLGEFSPPIIEMRTIDTHWDETKTDEDYCNLFCAGRPRWWSYYTIKLNESNRDTDVAIQSLVELATNLLTGYQQVDDSPNLLKVSPALELDNIKCVDPIKVAIFTCRFSLGEFSKLSSLLVRHSLATITSVSSSRELVGCNYPSEPVLAEASARYTNDQEKLRDVLSHVLASFHDQLKLLEAPRGDLGEMCAAALLGFTMDSIRQSLKHAAMSQTVPLKELLSVFGCVHDNELSTKLVDQWDVNFSHFVRTNWPLTESNLFLMWKRRLAYYVPEGTMGLDLLVSIKRRKKAPEDNEATPGSSKMEPAKGNSGPGPQEEGAQDKEQDTATYGTLRIQVKDNSNKIANGLRTTILGKLWPSKCPPDIPNETFSVGLLLCLGEVESCWSLHDYDTQRLCLGQNEEPRANRRAQTPKRFVLQLATTFPTADSLREKPCFQHVAVAAPLLAKICEPSSKEERPDSFEQDALRQRIESHHLKKSRSWIIRDK